MLIPRFALWMFSLCLMVIGVGVASGQDYPNKPVRILTSGAGGGNDFLARVIAQPLSRSLDQQVIVENRAGLLLSIETVAKAPPDGYALLVAANTLWTGPLLRKLSYDTLKDFLPISLMTRAPTMLVVHPSLPVKTVKELIALAKARPGELNYGSSSIGASNHLAAELFKSMAGVNIVHIPFKGSGPALISLIGGQVQLFFATPGSVSAQVKSGKLRVLAVTSAEPTALFPGLTTVAASGLRGYVLLDVKGMFAPRGTPAAIISRLNREVVMALNQTDVKEMLFKAGAETVGSSPEQLAAAVESEIATASKTIKEAGIRTE